METQTLQDAMNSFNAIRIAEGTMPAERDEQIEAWQHLIDTGLAWRLQGSFGRNAMSLIEQGVCEGPVKA